MNDPHFASGHLTDLQMGVALSPFGVTVTDSQIAKIREYLRILMRWNSALNLTSVIQPVEIVSRHFGESLYAVPFLPVEKCRLVDIGTGAGFPGLALKIVRPSIQLVLIESNKKKCAFLAEVVRILGLEGVTIHCERYEGIRPEMISADIVTSRAVGDFKHILRWSSLALEDRGHLILWVGAEDSTIIASTSGWTWQPAYRLPDSQRRFIVIGRPLRDASNSQ